MLEHSEEADRIADQEVLVVALGEVAAGEDAGGRHGTDPLAKPLLVANALAEVGIAAGAAGAIVDELEAPAVEHVAMRVRSDREVEAGLEGARVETVDARRA